jgi:D-alanine transaminase
MQNAAYYNGRISPIEDMSVPMNDRALYFGDGVYEATLVKNHRIFALQDHLDRFYNSCALVKIGFPMSREELTDTLYDLVNRIDSKGSHILYWQSTRATAPRNHIFPDAKAFPPNLMAYVTPRPEPDMHTPIKLITAEDIRFTMCNVKTLNLLPNVLASQAAAEAGADEAVFHRGDMVTECAHSNVHIIKDGVLRTAPLSNLILPGTVRKHLLAICEELSIPVDQTAFTLEDLQNADEILVTSATALVRRAAELNGKPAGGRAAGLFERIISVYEARIAHETE